MLDGDELMALALEERRDLVIAHIECDGSHTIGPRCRMSTLDLSQHVPGICRYVKASARIVDKSDCDTLYPSRRSMSMWI